MAFPTPYPNHFRPGKSCNAMGKVIHGNDQSLDVQSVTFGDQSVGKLSVCQDFSVVDDSVLSLVIPGQAIAPFVFSEIATGATLNDASNTGFANFLNSAGGPVAVPGLIDSPNYDSVTGLYTASKIGNYDFSVELVVFPTVSTANFSARLIMYYTPFEGVAVAVAESATLPIGTITNTNRIPLQLSHTMALAVGDAVSFRLVHNSTGPSNAGIVSSNASAPTTSASGRFRASRRFERA